MKRIPAPIVFLHLFKCGGTTIIERMRRMVGPDRLYHHTDPTAFRRLIEQSPERLHDYAVIAGHLDLETIRSALPDAPVMTVLRDPVDRLLSQYSHFRREFALLGKNGDVDEHSNGVRFIAPGHQQRCTFCAQNDFATYIADGSRFNTVLTRNYMTRRLAGLKPADRTKGPHLLAAALANLNEFALVMTTEAIDREFDDAFAQLLATHRNEKPRKPLILSGIKRRNVSQDRHSRRPPVSPDTLNRITQLNRLDMALFAAARWFAPNGRARWDRPEG